MLDFCTKYCQQNLQKKPKKLLILGFLKQKDNADANKNKQISRFIIMKVRAFLPSIAVAGTDVSLQFNKIRKSFDDFRIYPTFIIKFNILSAVKHLKNAI